ncbi:MAG TPA: MFS transporter [Ktedonobacterales bacterium]|nr:MFS transporter [Ktedonobacterales bacterium]
MPTPRPTIEQARAPVVSVPYAQGRGFLTLLRNPSFLKLWLAQVISQTMVSAASYGMVVLIAIQSQSVTATGGAIVAFSLPTALFAAPAGVFVDRLDKRRVMWVSNALRGIVSLGFVASLFIDSHALVPVYLLSFSVALISQFFAPAEGAAIPLLVHADELPNALGLFNLTYAISQAAGLIVLGPLILAAVPQFTLGAARHPLIVTQVELLFLLIALLYGVCVLLILAIPRARLTGRSLRGTHHGFSVEDLRLRGLWKGVTEGWMFMKTDRRLLVSMLQFSLGNTVLSTVAMIAPRFVEEFFHQPPQFAALVFLPAGIGLILGSIVVPQAVKRVRGSHLILAGFLTLAISMLLITFARWVATMVYGAGAFNHALPYLGAILALTFALGVGLDLVNVPSQTVMQQRSPDWIKGRILALQIMISNAFTVPVLIVVGLFADAIGLSPAITLVALGTLAAGSVSVLIQARYRRHTAQKA